MAKKKRIQKHRQVPSARKQKRVTSAKKKSHILWVIPLILLLSFLIFIHSLSGDFVWDDHKYIENNPLITSIDLRALFSTYVMGNYHPFTMLGYAIEYQFFGLSPMGYHIVNLVLHLINILLVFYVVLYLSNETIVALLACLLFGIHPMHVESIAWVSELKDLLYTFFFLASYLCYLKYFDQQNKKWYYFSLFLFLCSMLSKAMAASLPVLLLLTDYLKGRKITRNSILEKLPFILIAVILGITAIYAQKSSEAIQDISKFPFLERIVFASYGFITYLVKLILPIRLSAFYPYPISRGEDLPFYYYFFPLVCVGIIGLAIYSLRFSKKILFGIGFFVITIFLVLQLLPVGDALMADRYSYIPSIGLFYLAGQSFFSLWKGKLRMLSILVTGIFVIFFSVQTFHRCGIWENDIKLWSDVIDNHPGVAVAYNNRGGASMNAKQYEQALSDYNKAIELRAGYYDAYNNRGILLSEMGKKVEALTNYNKAVEMGPQHSEVYNNRGLLLMEMNKYPEALADLNRAIELRSNYSQAYYNRGLLAMNEGNAEQALGDYKMAIKFNPRYMEAYINSGVVFHQQNKIDEAISEYNKALKVAPSNPQIYYNRGIAFVAKKRFEEAISDFSKTIELKSDYAAAYYSRGMAMINTGKKDMGCRDIELAAKLGFEAANSARGNFCK